MDNIYVRRLKPLTERARNRAYEAARVKLAGPIIDPKKFVSAVPSKYPGWIVILVVIPLIVLLGAAFLPSAYRIHTAGTEEFCRAAGRDTKNQSFSALTTDADPIAQKEAILKGMTDDDKRCDIVGISTVLLAEIGQIVFFFALAVLGDNAIARRMYWGGVLMSTLIALVGNAHISQPWRYGYLFGWLETFIPPIMVMSIGYTIKELLLYFVAKRRSKIIEIAQAEERRARLLEEPETGGREWLRLYSLAIKSEYFREYASNDRLLQTIPGDEWQQMIKEEMQASEFVVDPTKATRLETSAQEKAEREAAERAKKVEEQRLAQEAEKLRLAAETEERARQAWVGENITPAIMERSVVVPVTVSRNGHEEQVGEIVQRIAMPRDEDEIWMADSELGLWGARDSQTGYVIGVTYKTRKMAELALRRHKIQIAARKNGK